MGMKWTDEQGGNHFWVGDADFRMRARDAYDAQEREYAQRRKDEAEKSRARTAGVLKNLLKSRLSIESNPTDNRWVVGGIAFYADTGELHITEPCPDCDGSRTSYEIRTLADVGRTLAGNGWLHHEHFFIDPPPQEQEPPLPPAKKPETLEQVLTRLIEAVVVQTLVNEREGRL